MTITIITLFPISAAALQAATHDPVEEIREKMLGHLFDLLYQRPEQEKRLLSVLVNKLGDPHRKVASRAVMLLLKLRQLREGIDNCCIYT